jgi:hypothetical protein
VKDNFLQTGHSIRQGEGSFSKPFSKEADSRYIKHFKGIEQVVAEN